MARPAGRRSQEAIGLIGAALSEAEAASAIWLLDQPVSNSGRLAHKIRELSAERGWPWTVEVVMNPDQAIRASDQIAVTSDSNILDGVARWINLNRQVIEQRLPRAGIVDLGD